MWKRLWRNAFWESIELWVAMLCLLVAVPILLNPVAFAPLSLQGQTVGLLYGWGAALLLGGGLNAQGILFSNLYTRRAGLALLSGACACLTMILVATADPIRLVAIITYLSAAVSFGARYWALGKLHSALHLVARLEQQREE